MLKLIEYRQRRGTEQQHWQVGGNTVRVQGLPEWTLLGEYCGVWDKQAPATEAKENDSSALDDPVGLGPLLRDKVSELGYTSSSAPADAANGRPPPTPQHRQRSSLHPSTEGGPTPVSG